jgi:exosortase D (VPLPA-CTERM-specific)
MQRQTKIMAALALLVTGLGFLYSDVVVKLVKQWATDDNYSHGFLIVPISLYFVWERRNRLAEAARHPSILGIFVVLGSLVMLAVGMLGAELFMTRVALLATLAGILLFTCGWQHLKILAFPLAFLLLMIPLPAIIFNEIAFPLQLLAARLGAASLMELNVPVLREGNLIVLASTTLEVTEACSGIRSLISLLTLGIVFGYFTDSRASVRTAIALATIPVAIFANGLRILGTGLAVQWYGPKAAEAFFHAFSGWLLFIVAFVMLFLFQRLILWIAPSPGQLDGKPATAPNSVRSPVSNSMFARMITVTTCLVVGTVFLGVATKTEAVPVREPLSSLPTRIGSWKGQPTLQFSSKILSKLGVDEYVSRFYLRPNRRQVHLYVGYYQSQRQGSTVHSPKNCLPGGGWVPVDSGHITIPGEADGTIEVNRYLLQKGTQKQVVLYWYQSRGRVIASEYWAKIYLVVDAIRLNRTDGALVRVISPVADSEMMAEQQAIDFVKELYPLLGRHLPA